MYVWFCDCEEGERSKERRWWKWWAKKHHTGGGLIVTTRAQNALHGSNPHLLVNFFYPLFLFDVYSFFLSFFFERDVYSFFVCESWPWFLVLHLLVLLLDSWPLESVALNILESLNCFHFTVTFYNNWLTSEHNWCRLFVTFDLVDYLYGHKQLLEMWGEFKQKLKRE